MARLPESVHDHYRRVQALQSRALRASWAAWAQLDPGDLAGSWQAVLPALTEAIGSVQLDAAAAGASYGALTLASQDVWVAPSAFVNDAAWAGFASSGARMQDALYSPVPAMKQRLATGTLLPSVLDYGRTYLEQLVRTQIADTARSAASVDIASRPDVGYTRMLNPPSCDRCVVLAGRFYRWNAGFRRHPRCDCVHVMTTARSTQAATREGLVDDPRDYFDSLSAAEQDRLFGNAGATAIRDGADISRVVNARRGASGFYTTEGTTRRGFARGLSGRRLTPDGIYRTARSREEAMRLLETHGYVLRGGALPKGRDYEGSTRGAMTAADRRLADARARFEAVLQGRNPWSSSQPLTPELAARAEADFRRWLSSAGQIYTQ